MTSRFNLKRKVLVLFLISTGVVQNKNKKVGDRDDDEDEGRAYQVEWGFQRQAHQRESHLRGGGVADAIGPLFHCHFPLPRQEFPRSRAAGGRSSPPVLLLSRLHRPVQQGQTVRRRLDYDNHVQDRGGQEGVASPPSHGSLARAAAYRGRKRGGSAAVVGESGRRKRDCRERRIRLVWILCVCVCQTMRRRKKGTANSRLFLYLPKPGAMVFHVLSFYAG